MKVGDYVSIKYEIIENSYRIIRSKKLQYVAHLHRDIEMIYVLKGQTKAYLDSAAYVLNEGDLFVSFPNKVHYYNTFTDEESYLIIFPPDYFEDFKSFFLKNDPVKPVIRKADLPQDVCEILSKMYSCYQSDDHFKKEKIKGYFNILLSDIIPCFEFMEKKNDNADMISSILSYCAENYKESITLDDMAKNLHVSKYYISRLFSEKIKISLNNYINMLRVNDAKERLLKTNDSVTEIGIKVGYNTIRSFNRAFLSQTGLQPREYRNKFGKKIVK